MSREDFELLVSYLLQTYHLYPDYLIKKDKHFPLNEYRMSSAEELVSRCGMNVCLKWIDRWNNTRRNWNWKRTRNWNRWTIANSVLWSQRCRCVFGANVSLCRWRIIIIMRRRERSDGLVERVSELILVQIVCCFQMNELVVWSYSCSLWFYISLYFSFL